MQTQNIAAAWRTRAPWLARWAMYHLVNRNDLWGRYLADGKQIVRPDGSISHACIAPPAARRGQILLTEAQLNRHFAGDRADHLLGIHSISEKGTARWLALDIYGAPQSTEKNFSAERNFSAEKNFSAEGNFSAAVHYYDDLIAAGFQPLLTDADGAGGYHLWIVFDEPVESARAAEFGRALAADAGRYGLPAAPRTYPSLAAVRSGGRGNWMRLPGRHYRNDHWTRVWNGRHWLAGADAVEAILHAHGDPTRLLRDYAPATTRPQSTPRTPPAVPATASATRFDQAAGSAVPAENPNVHADRVAAMACIDRINPRRAQAYHEWLRLGMALHDIDPSEGMLAIWDRWSKPVSHYAPGLCAQHWQTFSGSSDRHSSLVLLREWADQDAAESGNGVAAAQQSGVAHSVAQDADLQEVINGWPALSSQLQGVVLGMVRACRDNKPM